MRVLCIDDSPLQIKLMSIYLKSNPDLEMIPALGAKLGLEKARLESMDIILLDLEMPEMNGEEVLKALKSSPLTDEIPVIIFSSCDEPGIEEKLMKLGAAAFLKKPHGIQTLNNMINVVIRNNNARAN